MKEEGCGSYGRAVSGPERGVIREDQGSKEAVGIREVDVDEENKR